MTTVPETSWLPRTEPNPDYRWWKPWLPREVLTAYGKLGADDLLEAIPFQRLDHPPENTIAYGHICFFINNVEGHIDLTCEEEFALPTNFADAADSAKKAFSIALDEIAKQVKG
jgi:hypothetical protein